MIRKNKLNISQICYVKQNNWSFNYLGCSIKRLIRGAECVPKRDICN